MPLLLGLGREERALGAALESGDADLVYLVLFRMQRTQPLQQFLAALAGRPQARALFSAYCAHTVLSQNTGSFRLLCNGHTIFGDSTERGIFCALVVIPRLGKKMGSV